MADGRRSSTPYGRSPRSPRTALAAIGISTSRRKRDAVPLTDVDPGAGGSTTTATPIADAPRQRRERTKPEVRPAPLGDKSGGRDGERDRSRSHGEDEVTLGAVDSISS